MNKPRNKRIPTNCAICDKPVKPTKYGVYNKTCGEECKIKFLSKIGRENIKPGHIKMMDIPKRIKLMELREQGKSFNQIAPIINTTRQNTWLLHKKITDHGYTLANLKDLYEQST